MSSTNGVLAVYKPVGVTSHRVAMRLAEKLGTVVTHTGNLDPMAEGVLILLAGPEAKQRQPDLQSEDKEYEFDLLLGFSTDSYDALGMVTGTAGYDPERFDEPELNRFVSRLVGRRRQFIPPYSSKVIKGKPLFWWAREGRLEEIGRPEKEIEVTKAEIIRIQTITTYDLKQVILRNISQVTGDFRQSEISKAWADALDRHPNRTFTQATIRVGVSAGTYVRSLAHELGPAIGIPSLALRIVRTRSGGFGLSDCRPLEDLI